MTKKPRKGLLGKVKRLFDWGVKEAKRITIWCTCVAAAAGALISVRSCIDSYRHQGEREKAVDSHFSTIEGNTSSLQTHVVSLDNKMASLDSKVERLVGGMDVILRLHGVKPESVSTQPATSDRVAASRMTLEPPD